MQRVRTRIAISRNDCLYALMISHGRLSVRCALRSRTAVFAVIDFAQTRCVARCAARPGTIAAATFAAKGVATRRAVASLQF